MSVDPQEILKKLLSEAKDLTDEKFTYTNNAQLYFSSNELIVDFYYVGPNAKPNALGAEAQRLQRIVLPMGVAKEIAELILSGVSNWEDVHGITLPIIPTIEKVSDEKHDE